MVCAPTILQIGIFLSHILRSKIIALWDMSQYQNSPRISFSIYVIIKRMRRDVLYYQLRLTTSFIFFCNFSLAPPKITLPAVVEALPGYRVKIPVTGTPPIYTAVIRNSTVLVNTTYAAAFQFYKESNCTSVAFNKYGYDTREFSVIFKGKDIS